MARRTPGPYLPVDVNFDGNPKIAALSDPAFRLHISGMLYCKRKRVDGIISSSVVGRLVPNYKPRYLTELVDRMLLVELDGTDHYQIHDWLDWNRASAEAQETAAKRRAAAKARWAANE